MKCKFKVGDRVRFLGYVGNAGDGLPVDAVGTVDGISEEVGHRYPIQVIWDHENHVDDGYRYQELEPLIKRKAIKIKSKRIII